MNVAPVNMSVQALLAALAEIVETELVILTAERTPLIVPRIVE